MEKCKNYLKDKITINMQEYKSGKYKSRAQAIAVSYAQIKKRHPECKNKLGYRFQINELEDIIQEHKLTYRDEDGLLILKYKVKNNGNIFNKIFSRLKSCNKSADILELQEGNTGYILISWT